MKDVRSKKTLKFLEPNSLNPSGILFKSTAGRYRPVSYPAGPITARYRFTKNANWEGWNNASCVERYRNCWSDEKQYCESADAYGYMRAVV